MDDKRLQTTWYPICGNMKLVVIVNSNTTLQTEHAICLTHSIVTFRLQQTSKTREWKELRLPNIQCLWIAELRVIQTSPMLGETEVQFDHNMQTTCNFTKKEPCFTCTNPQAIHGTLGLGTNRQNASSPSFYLSFCWTRSERPRTVICNARCMHRSCGSEDDHLNTHHTFPSQSETQRYCAPEK